MARGSGRFHALLHPTGSARLAAVQELPIDTRETHPARGRLVSRRLAVALALVVTLAANTATAQTSHESDHDAAAVTHRVEVLSAEGVEAYKGGRYREALARFKAALALQPVANLLFNIARTHEKLDETAEAITYYERFERAPDADPAARTTARARVRELREELLAKQAANTGTGTGTMQTGTGTGTPSSDPTTLGLGATAQPDHPMRTAGWVLVGAGGAVVVTGAVLGGLALGAQSEFEDTTQLASKRSFSDDAKSYALASDVTLGVGIAALGAGVVLVILDATSGQGASTATEYPAGGSSSTATWSVLPTAGPDGAGVSAGVSF